MKKPFTDLRVGVSLSNGRFGIWIEQDNLYLADYIVGPSFKTKAHAERRAKKLRKLLGAT
jgi:hypothetical protein